MATLMGDSISGNAWMRDLRDASTTTWSRPVNSKQLDDAHTEATGSAGRPASRGFHDVSKRLHKVSSTKVQAVETEVDLRVVGLCQKPSSLRTQEDIKHIQSYMCSLSYFFALWPAPLQWELSRLISVHILARREVALTRGRPPDRLYFIVQGRLDVRAPVPSPGGGREERTLAVLSRGQTVGESILLGSTAQHTAVVVSSSSAVLLSLSQPDFSRAFKEVLDIRQAERLMYLRLHPLLAGLPLPDLEVASEVLGLAFFPPGTRLWPLDEPDRCLYFLSEGHAKVKRLGGPAGQQQAHAPELDASGNAYMYDRYTVCVLGPGDIFGLPSSDQALALQLQQATAAASQPGHSGTGGAGSSPYGTATGVGLGGAAAAAVGGPAAELSSVSQAQHLAPGAPTVQPSAAVLGPMASAASCASGVAASGVGAGAGGAAVSVVTATSAAAGAAGGAAAAAAAAASAAMMSNVVIESFSQVKVYYVRYADYPRLPAGVQHLLQTANAFRWSYYEGRMGGLSKMDNRRRDAQREQLARKAANAALQRKTAALEDPLQSEFASAAMELAERDKQLLARMPILSVSMMSQAQAQPASTLEQQAFDARRMAQVAESAQQTRDRLRQEAQRHQQDGGGAGGGGGRGAAGEGGERQRRDSSGMPAWAMPGAAGRGMIAGQDNDGQSAGGAGVGGKGGAGGDGTGAGGRWSATQVPGGGIYNMEGRPGSADSVSGRMEHAGSVFGGGAASVAGTVAALGRGGSTHSTRGLNPRLHRNKALVAVQAQQLARVLVSERELYGQRMPLIEGRGAGGADEDEFAPWMAMGRSPSWRYPRSMPSSPPSRPRSRESQPPATGDPAARVHASPQRTLGLLPPNGTTFPKVQCTRSHTVETEAPRSVSVPQSVKQRHLMLFRQAQAMASAESNGRPWQQAARLQRPYSRAISRSSYPSHAPDPTSTGPSGASALLGLPGPRYGSSGSGSGVAALPFDAAMGASGLLRTPSGRPQRPDDRLSRYGSAGRASSAGGHRSSGGQGGATGSSDGSGPLDLPSPKSGFGAGLGGGGGLGAGSRPGGVERLPAVMSPELSFSHLGVKELSGEGDDSSEEGEMDLLYSGMDDTAVLAKVPQRLLGAGKAGGEGAAGGGGGGGGGSGGGATPRDGGPQGQAASPPRAKGGSGGGSTGRVVALPLPRLATGSSPSSSPRGGAVSPTGGIAAGGGDGGGGAGGGGGGGGVGGLNFTLRRNGAGGASGGGAAAGSPAGGAKGRGGSSSGGAASGGSSAGPAAAAPPAAVAGSGASAQRSSNPVGPSGGGGGGGNAAASPTGRKGTSSKPLDAAFPQDLDEMHNHHYSHHTTSTSSISAAGGAPPPLSPSGRNAPGTPPPPGGFSPAHTGASSHGHAQHAQHGQQPLPPMPAPPPAAPPALAAQHVAPVAVPVGIPPGIALGYENLDPFQWAALSAQVGAGLIKAPFTQENLLPKPQW